MSKSKNDGQGGEFMRALWHEQREIEKSFAVIVELDFVPTTRAGVYTLRLTATGPVVDEGLLVKVAAIQAEYPNSSNGLLEAFMFQMIMKLGHLVSQARRLEQLARDPQ